MYFYLIKYISLYFRFCSREACDQDDIVGARGWRWLEERGVKVGRGSPDWSAQNNTSFPLVNSHNTDLSLVNSQNTGCSLVTRNESVIMTSSRTSTRLKRSVHLPSLGPLLILWLLQFFTGEAFLKIIWLLNTHENYFSSWLPEQWSWAHNCHSRSNSSLQLPR